MVSTLNPVLPDDQRACLREAQSATQVEWRRVGLGLRAMQFFEGWIDHRQFKVHKMDSARHAGRYSAIPEI